MLWTVRNDVDIGAFNYSNDMRILLLLPSASTTIFFALGPNIWTAIRENVYDIKKSDCSVTQNH